jgi:hypothetical protein
MLILQEMHNRLPTIRQPIFECLTATMRIIVERKTIRKDGSPIHKSSLLITIKPHLLKKALTPIRETIIGVQGKKYLVFSKGDSRAIPKPPFVEASRMP